MAIVMSWRNGSRVAFRFEQIRHPQADVVDTVLRVFQSIWESLSQLPVDHCLYLPPLYQNSPTLTNMLKHFVGELVSRENGSLLQSGNMILNGVQGTGKTTLLKAMVLVVAICCDKFFFIYHNYKNSQIWVCNVFCTCALIAHKAERTKCRANAHKR